MGMKLIRYGEIAAEKPGLILASGKRIAVPEEFGDYDERFFAGDGIARLAEWANNAGESRESLPAEVRLGSPIARPSKIVCVGLNYSDHAAETGAELPAEPVLFFKATSAQQGPNDPLVIPRGSKCTDWEVELAIVIGKRASYVFKENALNHVAGYMLHNDYSEREWQKKRAGQWVKGKSADSFAPMGPWMATPDEIADPGNLKLWLKVNGELKQNGNTKNLIFDIPTVVSYISQFMTLLPGDVISTGTPAGVGMGHKPPQYLKSGDVVELSVECLGEQRQVAM